MTTELELRDGVRHGVFVGGASSDEFASLAATLNGEGFDVRPLADSLDLRNRTPASGVQIAICSTHLVPEVRRQNGHDDVYVIAIGGAEFAGSSLRSGADDYLSTPLDAERVRARLHVARRVHSLREAVLHKNVTLTAANRKLEEANRRIHDELQAAAAVQQSLLPARNLRIPGMQVGWRLRPCEELAGDILNCFRLDENHLAFYVLDVSGHGVSSALLSVQVSRLMSPLLSESALLKEPLKEPPWYRVVEPSRVAASLNQTFQTSEISNKYFTMVYGTLHVESGKLSLVAAGQPSPLLVSPQGVVSKISCPGLPIGFFSDAEFGCFETTLEPGARLWLYSDGIIEADDGNERMLGADNLQELITRYADRTPQEATDRIIETVEAWSHPNALNDDCSLLAIERA